MPYLYQWEVREDDKRGRERWRLLRWKMSDEQAASWMKNEQNVGRVLRKVDGSGEDRPGYTFGVGLMDKLGTRK